MLRFLVALVLTALPVHAALHYTNVVMASNGSCTASGADGCSCQTFVCDTNDVGITCFTGDDYSDLDGCVSSGPTDGESSYETSDGANATVCVSTGPLVGAGCSNSASTACKIVRSCPVSSDGICEPLQETEAGYFMPCTQNN
ncbi:MAG: hypothetical protein KDA89_05315 [Planctomycetaceae bacterium]|nr:hypothetical protein [Planctomycetaceae bacterium]